MFCPNCGAQINDDSTFCGNCGAPVNAQAPQPPQQPPQAPNGAQNPYQYQAPQQQPYGFAPQAPVLPMKWYKFLIYFLLFAMGIINIFGGISALTGGQYTVDGENVSKAVYDLWPNLKTIDIIYGIGCIALGGFQIFLRFQLSSYKAKAPIYILVMYAATAVVTAVYSFVVVGIVPNDVVAHSELISQGIGGIVGACVAGFLNKIYFDKRKFLFIN